MRAAHPRSVISMIPLLVAVGAVTAGWAFAAAQTYLLAVRRGRMAVLRNALQARMVLVAAALAGPIVAAAVAVVSVPRALIAAPLLILPAAVALRWTLPPLRGLVRTLRADPWGPSDTPIRRAAADPALTVPARSALACAPAALLVLSGGWLAVIIAYGLAGTVTATLAWRAPRRRGAVEYAGVLRRVVVRAALPMEPAARRQAA
jgi:hypothetical protein